MQPITFDNISITGINYNKLVDVQIEQRMNHHASAKIICEMDQEDITRFLAQGKDGQVWIQTSAEGQPSVLFCGIKKDISVLCEGEYKTIIVDLASTSFTLDREKKQRTFQNTQTTCEELLNKIVAGKAYIKFNVTDKPVGSLIYQSNETDWELMKRIASLVNAVLSVNITTPTPIITVGIPDGGESSSVPEGSYIKVGKTTDLAEEDLSLVELDQYISNASLVTVNGASSFVHTSVSSMKKGTLSTTYSLGDSSIYKQEKVVNPNISGKILTGTVQAVEKDKVKVHFDQIDTDFDASGDTWFEYATAYASNGGPYGSGFYFMPEVNDRVKVMFPSAAEETGFAFASECVSPLEDPKHVKWRAPGGQEILFTETGIKITGKEDSIYIELIQSDSSEYGITVKCEKDINLNVVPRNGSSPGDINIYGKEKVVLYGDGAVMLRTPDAELHMSPEKIVTSSKYLYID